VEVLDSVRQVGPKHRPAASEGQLHGLPTRPGPRRLTQGRARLRLADVGAIRAVGAGPRGSSAGGSMARFEMTLLRRKRT